MPRNRVVISSGRDSGDARTSGSADCPYRSLPSTAPSTRSRGAWRCNIRPASWDPKLLGVARTLRHGRRPARGIERKQTALAWHYREADSWLGQLRAQQLVNALMPLCARLNLHIHARGQGRGDQVAPTSRKAPKSRRLLRQERYDFILALGDDTTDDDMFAALPPRALSIKIGNASEHARYNMPRTEPRSFLCCELLARDRGSFDPAGRETRDPHDIGTI